jgi:flagellar hook-associated protein 3 FlgL
MRATGNQIVRQTLFDLNKVTERLAKDQRQLSGGKAISQPEDDPFGAGRAIFLRGEISDVQQFQRTINEGTAWLDTSDIALNNVTGAVQRLRELVMQAANGTNDQGGLDAIAAEVGQLKETIREQANTTFAGRFIFSGTATTTRPYPGPGNTTAGNAGSVQRLIAPGQTVAVNQLGTDVFGADGANLFDLIDTIQSDLTSGNRQGLGTTALNGLDAAADRILNARANVGALTNRLETQMSRLKDQEVNVASLLSKTEDADMAKTMVSFATHQATYQAALQAGAKVIQPSLLDFLR